MITRRVSLTLIKIIRIVPEFLSIHIIHRPSLNTSFCDTASYNSIHNYYKSHDKDLCESYKIKYRKYNMFSIAVLNKTLGGLILKRFLLLPINIILRGLRPVRAE